MAGADPGSGSESRCLSDAKAEPITQSKVSNNLTHSIFYIMIVS